MFKLNDTVVIKGYKKPHKIIRVYTIAPPKSKSFTAYQLSDRPSNQYYEDFDLIKIKSRRK